jgi:hypothetical protein
MKPQKNRIYSLLGTFALLVLLFSALSACQSMGVTEYPDAAGRWKYRVDITKPDTENEGRRAHLYYRGKELAGYFSTVVIGETKYDYTFRINPSDFGGYAKDPDYSPPPLSARLGLEDEELKRGWYFAALNQRRQDTPADWIWVKRENLEAFVDPDRLYNFINKYELIPKVDEREPPVRFLFSFGVHS